MTDTHIALKTMCLQLIKTLKHEFMVGLIWPNSPRQRPTPNEARFPSQCDNVAIIASCSIASVVCGRLFATRLRIGCTARMHPYPSQRAFDKSQFLKSSAQSAGRSATWIRANETVQAVKPASGVKLLPAVTAPVDRTHGFNIRWHLAAHR